MDKSSLHVLYMISTNNIESPLNMVEDSVYEFLVFKTLEINLVILSKFNLDKFHKNPDVTLTYLSLFAVYCIVI